MSRLFIFVSIFFLRYSELFDFRVVGAVLGTGICYFLLFGIRKLDLRRLFVLCKNQ